MIPLIALAVLAPAFSAQAAALSPQAPVTPESAAPAAAAVAAASAKKDEDKVSCQEEEVTGSTFTKRVCHPHSVWMQLQRGDGVNSGGRFRSTNVPR